MFYRISGIVVIPPIITIGVYFLFLLFKIRFNGKEPKAPTPIASKLLETRLTSISNGTTWFNRVTILALVCIIVSSTVLASKTPDINRFYWPPPGFFFSLALYYAIPVIWIGFNYQMKYVVQNKSSNC